MLNTQNVAVAVDLSKTDEKVLQYTNFLAKKLFVKRINLIHIIPSILSAGNADLEMHLILGPGFSLKSEIEEKILETSSLIFKNGQATEIDVLEGSPYQDFINRADDIGAGLVVFGRKRESEGSGITAKRVARNFYGNVLFVPEDASLNISRITVPIDFSENSARALRVALDISEKIKGSMVRCVHVVNSMPETYYLDIKTRSNLDAQFRLNADTAWQKFLEKNDLKKENIHIDYIQDYQSGTANLLNDFLKNNHTDFLVMGAKGHTAFENFLYGSVTERLADICDACPVLIIR